MSVTHAAHHIEVTAESLEEDLARLEIQKQALERELAAVVAHLSSVQRALGALQALMPPAGPGTSGFTGTRDAPPRATEAAAHVEPARPATEPADEESAQKSYGKLTEQILDYFAEVGDVDVRARDVAAALGRATDSSSINAVRSTLDRLVGTSRIRRTGRGLYRAV
ncbi:hypothetical protein [Streptomyces sp. NRRL S-1521]|uniref:hypothetical protein n=1 Tax=Streptomyces sp. NRRL S-1521 TaxID=1609100 RepID=UPI000747CDEE|nr:hypothetical protein [Streptomyces sp. NRRL S-1521]KUL52412.1 hypothetical protein ADL30_23840 [Streptomyces sp. NRRL S-1521]